jgi:two-component system, OmpR family, phosphate regulon sensor histidine kinase PhoR
VNLGVRSKLFAISVALILGVGLSSGLYLEDELRQWLEQRVESELLRQARAAGEALAGQRDPTAATVDDMADRLAAAFQGRVTVIAPDGWVLGDSDLGPAGLLTVDNHGRRPEVLAALAHGFGQSRRYSHTVDTDMLYVAVPYPHAQGRGVVRVARALAEVDQAVARLRALLLVAGLVGLVIAVLMSGLAAHFMSRTLRELADSARAISSKGEESGAIRARIHVRSSDEIGKLAGSLNRLAGDIETTVTTLASERARFKAVLEGMSEGVIALDRDRRIRLMNSAALALLHLPEVPLDEPLIEHLRMPALCDLLEEPTASGTCELVLPGPEARQVLVRVSPEHEGEGCIIVMHDVTDLRRLETVRRDFVANVSHELRTPVSIIRANAETLLDGAASDPAHGPRLLDALHRNAERLSNIIADLLDLSRLEGGHRPLEREAVVVADAASHALETVEQRAREKCLEVVTAVEPLVRVHADESALEQILINYLDNAIKYTPAGGRITVSARVAGDRVCVAVSDNGPGIPPHLHGRVFERFFRVDPGRSRDMGGTGLGLSIVRHLAEAMDGQAGVEAATPHGARFWVDLPAAGS